MDAEKREIQSYGLGHEDPKDENRGRAWQDDDTVKLDENGEEIDGDSSKEKQPTIIELPPKIEEVDPDYYRKNGKQRHRRTQ